MKIIFNDYTLYTYIQPVQQKMYSGTYYKIYWISIQFYGQKYFLKLGLKTVEHI